jgi:serine/threonine protein kinase
MKALTDHSGRSSRGMRRSAQQFSVTTAAAYPLGGQAIEPAGRLVAGRYRLQSLLGRGGMGRVWLAEDELLHRPVALKQLVLSDPASEESRRTARGRALGEARAAARVHHDGVVAIHDLVKEDGCPWIVMELLSGRTLAETVDATGPQSIERVAHIGRCLLDVLGATHRAGIVHRDVKPANVHLCHGGRVVLTDFGIACTADDDSSFRTHTFAGSPAYASPERLRGDEAGPASDLFSLGATLFTAVEGKPPFDKGDLFTTLTAVAVDPPAPFRRAGPLRPVIEGLLAKEPHRRLNAGQARAALRTIQRERLTTTGHRPRSNLESP